MADCVVGSTGYIHWLLNSAVYVNFMLVLVLAEFTHGLHWEA